MRTKWYRDRAPRHGPWFGRYFRLRQAGRFYAVFGGAVAIGLLLDLLGTNSIKMLFLSVLINGVVAPRILGLVMLAANNQRIMGEQTNGRWLNLLGWATVAIMGVAAVAFREVTQQDQHGDTNARGSLLLNKQTS